MMHQDYKSQKVQKILNILFQEWTDNNLRWNESEYGNIADIRIPPSLIWAPDILMYNRLGRHFVLCYNSKYKENYKFCIHS